MYFIKEGLRDPNWAPMSKMKAGDSCHKLGCGMCVFKSTVCYTANKKSNLISHFRYSA